MESLFSSASTLWASPRNRLHVYALPGAGLQAELARYHEALAGADYCVPVAREFMHATVQQFATSLDEVTPEQVAGFEAELATLAAGMEPFDVEFGAPRVGKHGMAVVAESTPEWDSLVEQVRSAVALSINNGRSMPAAPFSPHISVGYGRGAGSSEDIQAASDAIGADFTASFRIDELHFLAVHQDPEAGVITWDPISSVKLGGSR